MAWLLDTHALLWALFEPAKLGRKARSILENASSDVKVSPVSYWEISLKSGLGKLSLPGTEPGELPEAVRKLGLSEEPLSSEILATGHLLARCPDHRDPFDRMMVWHAIQSGRILVSRDRSLAFYDSFGLKRMW